MMEELLVHKEKEVKSILCRTEIKCKPTHLFHLCCLAVVQVNTRERNGSVSKAELNPSVECRGLIDCRICSVPRADSVLSGSIHM